MGNHFERLKAALAHRYAIEREVGIAIPGLLVRRA
jgi:hypothetical protein